MLVVVSDVLGEKLAELPLVPDQGAVQEFVSHGANPTLRERVGLGCPGRCGDRIGTD
jgi:hypothetical protein